MNDKDPRREWLRDLGLFSVIVADLISYTGVGLGLGYLAWKELQAPWWVIVLTTLTGLWLAMYKLYRMAGRKGNSRKNG